MKFYVDTKIYFFEGGDGGGVGTEGEKEIPIVSALSIDAGHGQVQ